MVWVLYGNVHPYPPAPLRWFIYATLGVIVIAAGVAFWLEARRPVAMQWAGQVLADVDTEEETALAGRAGGQLGGLSGTVGS
jgi:hypothetical protein